VRWIGLGQEISLEDGSGLDGGRKFGIFYPKILCLAHCNALFKPACSKRLTIVLSTSDKSIIG